MSCQRSSSWILLTTFLLSVFRFAPFAVEATPNTTPGTINCTDLTKNRVLGFQLLDGSNNPLTQTVVTPFFNSSITIDLNDFANCDLNVRAVLDTPVPANCDINNIRCVRMTFGSTVRRDFNPPFTVFLTNDGTGRPMDVRPITNGTQILNACPYTEPSCQGRRPRCFQVSVTVIPCRNPPPVKTPVKVPVKSPVAVPTPVQAPVVAPTPVEAPITPPTPVETPVTPPTPVDAPVEPPIPVEAPVTPPTPVEAPVTPPTPVETPATPPTPVEAPVTPPIPVEAPIEPPTPLEAPVTPPTPVEAPVTPPTPVEAPVTPPTPVEAPVTPPTPVEAPVTPPTPVEAPVTPPTPVDDPVTPPVEAPVAPPTPVAAPVTAPVVPDTNVCTFTIGQAFGDSADGGSFAIDVTIAIAQLPTGVQFTVTETDADSTGDLRGLFFDVSPGFTLGPASAISGPQVNTASTRVSDNNVINLGNGANMNGNGNKNYDVGVEIGGSGVGGGDDFQTTVITVAWPGLTLQQLCGQAFGVRLTTSGPNGNRAFSSKIFGQSCACPPSQPIAPVPVAPVAAPVAPIAAPVAPVAAPVAVPKAMGMRKLLYALK